MAFAFRSANKDPDTRALKRLGEAVRARLAADPQVYQMPVEGLELYGVGGFFSPAECDRLIAIVDTVARPSPTYHNNGDSGRTSFSGDVDPRDPFIRMIQRRIDDLLGIAPELGETIQGQRYSVGQQFRNHFDYFLPSQDFWQDEQRRGGQRSWTAMAYLNAVEAGGETAFPRLEMAVPPQAGALLIWNNMGLDGRPNPQALHAGLPVVSGVKYVLTKWYRSRPWS
ncbi:2OG-Fe(II) oxygenase [Novosphingobium sp. FKTRR1]|uniref:prolyl hydroxylase family protein n=1 Tax=Novosphingobium sp. FKTRR1 TaxID=2879118 RepID=UPI001CF01138|nr:2OG-Fe(II) oxygenase [Novosphingobium sp. FKTRR1]